MTPAPENPPAFPNAPCPAYTDDAQYGQRGMTLRDWFAGQAMATMIPSITKESHVDTISKGAYLMADAMLAARTQSNENKP